MRTEQKIKEEIINYGNSLMSKKLSIGATKKKVDEIDEIISLLYTFKHSIIKHNKVDGAIKKD